MATTDILEIDFLAVETAKSGDAIPIRSVRSGIQTVYVVDGGYSETGPRIVDHIRKFYGGTNVVNHAVLTHPDGDHARGLEAVLENMAVERLWMNRPWLYAAELMSRFPSYTSVDRLQSRLRSLYPFVRRLEEIAEAKGIPVLEAFQGSVIGEFTVLSPAKATYLDLIVESDRTPEGLEVTEAAKNIFQASIDAVVRLAKAAWGDEAFSTSPTSSENEMSLVQYCNFEGQKFLLTGDAGPRAMSEAADYAPMVGLALPGIDRFQIPHHGSRRNLSTELADRWLGARNAFGYSAGFEAFVSSAKADPHHPRKVVLRAVKHRGGETFCTEGRSVVTGYNWQPREGYGPATPAAYPEDQEV